RQLNPQKAFRRVMSAFTVLCLFADRSHARFRGRAAAPRQPWATFRRNYKDQRGQYRVGHPALGGWGLTDARDERPGNAASQGGGSGERRAGRLLTLRRR